MHEWRGRKFIMRLSFASPRGYIEVYDGRMLSRVLRETVDHMGPLNETLRSALVEPEEPQPPGAGLEKHRNGIGRPERSPRGSPATNQPTDKPTNRAVGLSECRRLLRATLIAATCDSA